MVFDPKTGETTRILLGDGIADLCVDADDRIWVSYFDEGVFGNRGWGRAGAERPGAGGLVCFAADGRKLWAFNATQAPDYIVDCYALNAQRGELWAYYYSDFNLCRVDGNFRPLILSSPGISGSNAFAVGDDGFLFSHGYNEPAGTFHYLPRNGDRVGRAQTLPGRLPEGAGFEKSSMKGRGSCMHVLNDAGWFRADLSDQVG